MTEFKKCDNCNSTLKYVRGNPNWEIMEECENCQRFSKKKVCHKCYYKTGQEHWQGGETDLVKEHNRKLTEHKKSCRTEIDDLNFKLNQLLARIGELNKDNDLIKLNQLTHEFQQERKKLEEECQEKTGRSFCNSNLDYNYEGLKHVLEGMRKWFKEKGGDISDNHDQNQPYNPFNPNNYKLENDEVLTPSAGGNIKSATIAIKTWTNDPTKMKWRIRCLECKKQLEITKAEEYSAVQELQKQGLTLAEAVEKIAEKKGWPLWP